MSSEGRSGLYVYIVRRVAQAVPLVIGVIVFTFLLIRLAPGDPVYFLLGEQAGSVSEAYVQTLRHTLGFDQPLYIQLYLYLTRILTGDLGTSIINGQPVASLIWERIGP